MRSSERVEETVIEKTMRFRVARPSNVFVCGCAGEIPLSSLSRLLIIIAAVGWDSTGVRSWPRKTFLGLGRLGGRRRWCRGRRRRPASRLRPQSRSARAGRFCPSQPRATAAEARGNFSAEFKRKLWILGLAMIWPRVFSCFSMRGFVQGFQCVFNKNPQILCRQWCVLRC